MSDVKIPRNALGVIEELFKFIEVRTKWHFMFQELIDLADNESSIILKFFITTRRHVFC